jgi:hypothetical protein
MDKDPFIIYLSPRDVVLSRVVRRLVGKSVEVLKNTIHTLSVPAKLVRINPHFGSVPTKLVQV